MFRILAVHPFDDKIVCAAAWTEEVFVAD